MGASNLDWAREFAPRVLDRGYGYFADGLVGPLRRDSAGWHATVAGSADYRVFVPSSLDPLLASCACPHFADGNLCKHIAATLFAIESEGEEGGADGGGSGLIGDDEADGGGLGPIGDGSADGGPDPIEDAGAAGRSPSGMPAPALAQLVEEISIDELRRIVFDCALGDAAFARRLFARYAAPDAKRAKSELRQVTTDLTRAYGRGGFIDWRDSFEFESAYLDAVSTIVEPFERPEAFDDLIDLSIAALVQLQRICIDDSNGFFTSALDCCRRWWQLVFDEGAPGQRRRLFAALTAFCESNPGRDKGEIYWYQQECAEGFIATRFVRDPAYARDVAVLAERGIAEHAPEERGAWDINEYSRNRWRTVRLRALATMGASYEELLPQAEGLLDRAEGLQVLVDALAREGRTRDAVELLRDHLDAREFGDREEGAQRPPLVDQLIQLTESLGDLEELRALYRWLLLRKSDCDYRRPRAVETWYAALRGLYEPDGRSCGRASSLEGLPTESPCDPDEWGRERSAVLRSMAPEDAHRCIALDGDVDELYESVMADGGKDLRRFEDMLAPTHPEPYLRHYMQQARDEAGRAAGRAAYRQVARTLAHLRSLPGGEGVARHLAQEIRNTYPRRPALRDELRKAGFACE